MLNTVFAILLAFSLAIGGGAVSIWYALRAGEGFGTVTVDGWAARPEAGTDSADPYTDARVALEGVLALGSAEGLSFVAQRDSDGAPLRRDCAYKVSGTFPSARFWTLYAADETLALVVSGGGRLAALHSQALLRSPDNHVSLTVAEHGQPGNWLAVSGTGPMSLVLTFYDTPLASRTGLAQVVMPRIAKLDCGA